MNAKELADELTKMFRGEEYDRRIHEIPDMLRQQQSEIEELKHYIEGQNRKILDLSFALEYAKRTDEFVKAQEWVGLTDEERNDCLVDADPCECLADPEAEELMRCIEAKLKQKNGYAEEKNNG